jgi:hypothetical protein
MSTAAVTSAAATADSHVEREPVMLEKRIGSTTFTVAIHFSDNGKETLEDKILRLIEREVQRDEYCA